MSKQQLAEAAGVSVKVLMNWCRPYREEFEKMGFALVEVPFRPTSEELARYFFKELKTSGVAISRVEMYETPTNCAIYEET